MRMVTPQILKGLIIFQVKSFTPQHWPKTLDYAGKNVIVIGSGATAVTIVPAMATTAGHVTMLQTLTYLHCLKTSAGCIC